MPLTIPFIPIGGLYVCTALANVIEFTSTFNTLFVVCVYEFILELGALKLNPFKLLATRTYPAFESKLSSIYKPAFPELPYALLK